MLELADLQVVLNILKFDGGRSEIEVNDLGFEPKQFDVVGIFDSLDLLLMQLKVLGLVLQLEQFDLVDVFNLLKLKLVSAFLCHDVFLLCRNVSILCSKLAFIRAFLFGKLELMSVVLCSKLELMGTVFICQGVVFQSKLNCLLGIF